MLLKIILTTHTIRGLARYDREKELSYLSHTYNANEDMSQGKYYRDAKYSIDKPL